MPDPNNFLLPAHDVIFMLIPKAANTSTKMAILSALGIGKDADPVNRRLFEATNRGVMRKQTKQFCRRADGTLKITIVRHPFDRVLSLYHNKVGPSRTQDGHMAFVHEGITLGCSLDEFVDHVCAKPDTEAEQHYRSQTFDLADSDGLIPDIIGHFEQLPLAWRYIQRVCNERGLMLPELPYANPTPKTQQFTRSQIDRLAERYHDDLHLLKYAVE